MSVLVLESVEGSLRARSPSAVSLSCFEVLEKDQVLLSSASLSCVSDTLLGVVNNARGNDGVGNCCIGGAAALSLGNSLNSGSVASAVEVESSDVLKRSGTQAEGADEHGSGRIVGRGKGVELRGTLGSHFGSGAGNSSTVNLLDTGHQRSNGGGDGAMSRRQLSSVDAIVSVAAEDAGHQTGFLRSFKKQKKKKEKKRKKKKPR